MKAAERSAVWNFGWLLLAVVLLISGGILTACGGGGGGGGSSPGATAGLSAGTIQGFGSVIVNGVEFEDEGAEIEIEGRETPSHNDLEEGMLILVDGSFNADGRTGVASSISVEDTLEGPISAIQETTPGLIKVLTILNHRVIVENGVTHLDDTPPVTFANLAVDQVMEVSGHMGPDGRVQATLLEKKAETSAEFLADPNNEFEIMGMVSNLSMAASTFNIDALLVNFSGVTPRNGTLADGALVEVKGSAFDPATNTLTASDVELKAGLGANVAQVEIEGRISALDENARRFMLGAQMVSYSGSTVFRGGLEADLVNGAEVEAEGNLDANGVLIAAKITFKESVRMEGNVASLTSSSLSLEGLGLEVLVDADLTDLRGINAGLTNLAVGNEVKLRAREAAGGALIATRLELIDAASANRTIIQGPVSAFDAAAGSVTILGSVVVDTTMIAASDDSGQSNFEIEDRPVTRAEFFSSLDVGDIVKARADLPGLAWDEIEIELED